MNTAFSGPSAPTTPLQRAISHAKRALFGLASCALFGASPAQACVVCVELPEATLTDRIWSADAVVLARNTEDSPFSYTVTRSLVGHSSDPIPFLVGSTERRRMASDPERVAFFLHESGEWSSAGHGGAALTSFFEDVLANETKWSDEQDDPDRFAAFAALHAHPDPAIRRTALSEMTTVPYAQLRQLEVALDVNWINARLQDGTWFGWWPLLTQMLGLHPDPAAHNRVRGRALGVSAERQVPWLIALIEIDGADGIARSIDTLEDDKGAQAIIRALGVHARGTPALGQEIASALEHLASEHPELTHEAVRGLQVLGDYSLASAAAERLASGVVSDPVAAFALKSYLADARAGGPSQGSETRAAAPPLLKNARTTQ